ncbi:helix-turn-helix transcriptional regulator [Nocardia sp. NPDC004168]|uniref:helix-turn-helix transcriptional regulator n=1 Tax=Nocardia TaxID=1817 RepID=UPI0033B0E30A
MSVTFDHRDDPRPPTLASRERPALSSREIEVLLAWIASDSKVEVARRLYISLGTVNTHLARIRDKYAAVGRPAPTKAALVARALQDALIGIDDL